MTSRKQTWIPLGTGAMLLASVAVFAVGCEEEAPPPPPQTMQRSAAPPPPPAPKVTPIADLMAQYSIDSRVILPELKAPPKDSERIAVLSFFDAFARGDVDGLRSMLPEPDRKQLEVLVSSDVWEQTIEGITEIQVETGVSPYGQACALAIFEVHWDYQPQLWYYEVRGTGDYRFEAAPTPPDMMNKLYGDDRIALWHEILEEEIALANKPEIDFSIPQRDMDEDPERTQGSSVSPGVSPISPAPSGPGGRRPPPRPRPAPGPG